MQGNPIFHYTIKEKRMMSREIINEKDIESVVGGSIIFNAAHTKCGRNCNDQYQVNNYNDVIDYIAANHKTMTEKKMLANMVELGYISPL